ncbi:uncharacterized protein LOC113494749 isoform X3 [Trichoplusia ni]|uniref:Uncharacterized protein LOC113494749 isoform X3 n=1 Tax=Trichoplusia ni TaxID=7111 RepID=A0A7E5VL40_TRINI|nr:uncharacterized protein LOC113494749 isoform X3 [Trichoplusia ni]
MEVENHLIKFKLLLDNVFEGKLVLTERNTEQLLHWLEHPPENRPGASVLETPRFSDLILEAIKNIPKAGITVSIFLIKVVTILVKNELQFSKLQLQGLSGSCIHYCIIRVLEPNPQPPELQLACIKLATAHIAHCSGLKVLLENNVWRNILNSSIHDKQRPIANAGYKFLSELIQKLSEYEKHSEITEVLGCIVKPIISSEYLQLEVIDPETDEILYNKIKTYLNALLVILTDEGNSNHNIVVNQLRSYFLFDHPLFTLLSVTRLTSLASLLNDIAFRYLFGLYKNLLFADKSDEFCNEIVAYYHNCMVRCVKKRDIRAITDFCVKSIIFWSNFESMNKDKFKFPLTFERNGHKLELTNQVLLHLLSPIFNFSYCHLKNKVASFQDYIEENCSNILDVVADHTLSTIYLMRSLFDTTDMKQVMFETAKELFRLKGYLSTFQAGVVFQSLYHALNDTYTLSDEQGRLNFNENPMEKLNDEKLLSLLLDLIHMLLKEHTLCWYRNFEVICLQEILMNLLRQYILNTKQIVKILDLINICIKNFISPDMALLLESRQDSTLTEVGALMKTYLQHDDWEVKDSALNLLFTCIDVAYVKYTPLQKIIRDENLLLFAAKLALTDQEYYVQILSLKCLAYATKLDSIWRNLVRSYPQIGIHLLCTVRNNPQGMVRREAVLALTGIYINHKVSPNFQKSLYEGMIIAALDDFHSEVQKAALYFWYHVVQTNLSLRGMREGKFPSVTFSKEKKKILTLDEQEIARQLTSILNDLSSSGCLTVLLESMNEVNDVTVMKSAHCLSKHLVEILDQYKFQKVVDGGTTPPSKDIKSTEYIQDMSMDLGYEGSTEEFRKKVIDEIMSVNQSELIMNLYDRQQESKPIGIMDNGSSGCCASKRKLVNANKFLETFRSTDYETIINNKLQWNADAYSSLDALLDEILGV